MTPLLVAMLGFFVVAFDAQIVNVALPEIGSSLGGGLSGLQWVVTGYTLLALVVTAVRGDVLGPRRCSVGRTGSGWRSRSWLGELLMVLGLLALALAPASLPLWGVALAPGWSPWPSS